MTMSIQNQITQMQTQTNIAEGKKPPQQQTDANMFLKLMLQQLQYQDPTEPTSNEQWLAQLAQYSQMEEMQNLNKNFTQVGNILAGMSEDNLMNSSITQTLSLVGKEVKLLDPKSDEEITGKVEEASFSGGMGFIKVNGDNYPIGYILSVRDSAASQQ